MSYFTAVLTRAGSRWRAHDVDLDSVADLAQLTTALRALAEGDQPALLLVEREDAWWAVVRVDGDEDPRVFVSDVAGVAASPYAEVLAVPDADGDGGPDPGTCGGDLDLLADLGSSPEALREMCEEELLPMDALAAVADPAGFGEVLDGLR